MTIGTKEWAVKNVNFSKGCENGCLYCYARRIADRFGWKKTDDWTNMENKEFLAKKKFKKCNGTIMSPSSHDLTESNVELAIKVFSNILRPGNDLLIVSKPNPKIIQILCDNLADWRDQVLFRFTIGTLDEKIKKQWEPYAPSISDRIKALKSAFNSGWATSVSIEPFLSNDVIALIHTINPYISNTIWVGPMNKVHILRNLWNDQMTKLYSKTSLYKIKSDIDKLQNKRIRYKDHFLNILNSSKSRVR